VYKLFDKHVYARLGEDVSEVEDAQALEDRDAPELDDAVAHHYPTVLPFEPKLLHFIKLEALRPVLVDGQAWQAAARRVVERCRPDESAQDSDA
jgi:hypothetical protein